MEELRLAAEELRLAARLETGEGANLVPELESMVARDPGRERPAELLMIALYRAGRQSDALRSSTRTAVGSSRRPASKPGPGLHDLQRRILTHDPGPHPHDAVAATVLEHGRRAAVDDRLASRRDWLRPRREGFQLRPADLADHAHPSAGRSDVNAHRVAVARELRMDRRALDKVNAAVGERLQTPLAHRPVPEPVPNRIQALHWIEFDENTDRKDTARVLNDEAAADAVAVVGTPYTWEGATPSAGFDSSGLANGVWGRQGIVLPHNAAMQYYMASSRGQVVDNGPSMDVDRLAIGDLLFFDTLGHVSIYVGHGYVVDASHTGTFVQLVRVEHARRLRETYYGAARISG